MTKVIISGGGTGGHVFPAIAIANALRERFRDIDILFIGARGRMEMEKVPAAGYRIEGLTISGFQRSLSLKNLTFPFKLAGSLWRAWSILRRFQPDVVIGVGGYASGPTLRMAALLKIPSLIQEQNSFPGVTNRILAAKVMKICVAYDDMDRFFPREKIVCTGNPIRQEVIKIAGKREEALSAFGLDPGLTTLLVVGGSLGARTINQAIQKFVTGNDRPANLQVLWQTGKYYYEQVQSEIVSRHPSIVNLKVLPFIDRMDLAYAAADIIVSRAGAIAISELCVVGKPVILVPSPNVAEDHQTKNARALADRDAAIMVPDKDAVANLGQVIGSLLPDSARQSALSRNIARIGVTDAADRIAEEAMKISDELRMTNDDLKNQLPAVVDNDKIGDCSPSIVNRQSSIVNPSPVYFLGIGGIGMSALARYFAARGSIVSGYDRTPTSLTAQLQEEGMAIHFEEDPAKLPEDPGLVVYTPAVPASHQEVIHLKERGIELKKRAEVLGMIASRYRTIAVAGTHGKTTTTTLIAHILRTAGVPSLAFLGGISRNYGTNFLDLASVTGSHDDDHPEFAFCIVEADEYDKSFLQLTPYIAIITSVDPDHLDIYGNQDDLRRTFEAFTGKIVAGGSLVMRQGTPITPHAGNGIRVFDYSVPGPTAFHARNIRVIDDLYHFDFVHPAGVMEDLVLGVPGRFNLENAIAALTAGYLAGVDEQPMRLALATYQGVNRRFEFRVRLPHSVYIDDYAHHPEELKACIGAARELYPNRRITGVFQPHLYSRTRDLADDFARSLERLDELILLDIYPARELPIEGVSSQMLLDKVNIRAKTLVRKDELVAAIEKMRPEVLLTMGAGDIDLFAGPLAEVMERLAK